MTTVAEGTDRPGARAALAGDPFAHALRESIEARGLSLDRLAKRLAGRGVPLSTATLSYWQSGRRRPERPRSLAALQALEQVLEVPPGSLRLLLGPPRPRGRAAREAGLPPAEAVWEPGSGLAAVLAMLDPPDDTALTRISHHDRGVVDTTGRLRTLRTRQVLRAEEDGIDHWVLLHQYGTAGDTEPSLGRLRNCRPGRTVLHAGHRVLAAELVFERPLRAGETTLIEYELRMPGVDGLPPACAGTHARRGRVPVRECVLELDFPATAIPGWCLLYRSSTGDAASSRAQRLHPTEEGRVHAVGLDLPPCEFGIRWDYGAAGRHTVIDNPPPGTGSA